MCSKPDSGGLSVHISLEGVLDLWPEETVPDVEHKAYTSIFKN